METNNRIAKDTRYCESRTKKGEGRERKRGEGGGGGVIKKQVDIFNIYGGDVYVYSE